MRLWLLAIMVGLLALGHVCELSAFTRLDSHHAADHHDDGQIGSCDTMPTTSAAGFPTVSPAACAGSGFVASVVPLRSAGRPVEPVAKSVDRPPLFLLHASLLI